jgi:hypothetical protein
VHSPAQVVIELASDSKDFASALAKTQLAELKNAKIIPIPQPKFKNSGLTDNKLQDEIVPNTNSGESANYLFFQDFGN